VDVAVLVGVVVLVGVLVGVSVSAGVGVGVVSQRLTSCTEVIVQLLSSTNFNMYDDALLYGAGISKV
jgi:hypothetical protein